MVSRQGFDLKIGRGRGQIGEIQALAVVRKREVGEPARMRVLIAHVVILERAFAPVAQVIIEIRPRPDPAALAVIDMHNAIELFVQKPRIAAEQERAETAAVAGNEIQIIRVRPEVP